MIKSHLLCQLSYAPVTGGEAAARTPHSNYIIPIPVSNSRVHERSQAAMRCSKNRRSIGLRASASAARKCSRAISGWPLRNSNSPSAAWIERIVGEAVRASNRANLFEPALRTLALCDGDGAVERDDRRRANGQQLVVQRDDRCPVRLLSAMRGRMNPRDRGFEVILGQIRSRRPKDRAAAAPPL